jgi:hypothetical protein
MPQLVDPACRHQTKPMQSALDLPSGLETALRASQRRCHDLPQDPALPVGPEQEQISVDSIHPRRARRGTRTSAGRCGTS